MKNRKKLIFAIMSFCFVVALGVFGIFAVTNMNMSVGGNINFVAEGINATVSKGVVSPTNSHITASDETNKMKQIVLSTKTVVPNQTDNIKSWEGLNLGFNEDGDDVTISFSVKNDAEAGSNENVYMSVITNDGIGAYNATVKVGEPTTTITPQNTKQVVITFQVTDKSLNAELPQFIIEVKLSNKPFQIDEVFDTTLSSEISNVEIDAKPGDIIKFKITDVQISSPLLANYVVMFLGDTSLAFNYNATTDSWDKQIISYSVGTFLNNVQIKQIWTNQADKDKIKVSISISIEVAVISGNVVYEDWLNSVEQNVDTNIKIGDNVTIEIIDVQVSTPLAANYAIMFFGDASISFNYVATTTTWDKQAIYYSADADYSQISIKQIWANQADKNSIRVKLRIRVDSINVDENSTAIGYYFNNDGSGHINMANNNGLVTLANSTFETKVKVSKIKFWSLKDGTVRFGIGTLDKNNYASITETFDKAVTKGENIIDLSSENRLIPIGSQLFVYDEINNPGTELIAWKQNASADGKQYEMIYGTADGELKALPTTYGGMVSWQYFVTSVDGETEPTPPDGGEETDPTTPPDGGEETDPTDPPEDGETPSYQKVAVISHSWGLHGASSGIWWQECGMAASVAENDYVSMLRQAITAVTPTAQVSVVNVASWERNYSEMSVVDSVLDSTVDLIVIRVGENLPNATGYQEAITTFIEYMQTLSPNADFILCNTGLTNETLKQANISVGAEKNIPIADATFSHANYDYQKVGNYVEGWVSSDNKDTMTLYQITNSGVANHPSDVGMHTVANSILETAGYDPINLVYNIEVQGVVSYCPNKWVLGGVVTVHTSTKNLKVELKTGGSIEVTEQSDGVFTFYMPQGDVVVTADNGPMVSTVVYDDLVNSVDQTVAVDVKVGDVITFEITEVQISSALVANYAMMFLSDSSVAFNYNATTTAWDKQTMTHVATTTYSQIAIKQIWANSADEEKIKLKIKITVATPEDQQEQSTTTIGHYFNNNGQGNIQMANKNGLVTLANSTFDTKVKITQIKFWSLQTGSVRFGIGTLDQRNWASIMETFDVSVVAGQNIIDLSSQNYIIPIASQLFVYDEACESGKEMIAWKSNSSTDEQQYEMIYGEADGELKALQTTYGGRISLQYTVEIVEE